MTYTISFYTHPAIPEQKDKSFWLIDYDHYPNLKFIWLGTVEFPLEKLGPGNGPKDDHYHWGICVAARIWRTLLVGSTVDELIYELASFQMKIGYHHNLIDCLRVLTKVNADKVVFRIEKGKDS